MGDIADEHCDRLAEEGWFPTPYRKYGSQHFNRGKKSADEHAVWEFASIPVTPDRWEYECEHCGSVLTGFNVYRQHLDDKHSPPWPPSL